jgi:hypothetical protein
VIAWPDTMRTSHLTPHTSHLTPHTSHLVQINSSFALPSLPPNSYPTSSSPTSPSHVKLPLAISGAFIIHHQLTLVGLQIVTLYAASVLDPEGVSQGMGGARLIRQVSLLGDALALQVCVCVCVYVCVQGVWGVDSCRHCTANVTPTTRTVFCNV